MRYISARKLGIRGEVWDDDREKVIDESVPLRLHMVVMSRNCLKAQSYQLKLLQLWCLPHFTGIRSISKILFPKNHKSVSSGIYFRVCKRKFKKQTCLQTTSLMSTPKIPLPDLTEPSSIPLALNVATSNANQRENKHSGFLPFLRPTRNYHFDEYFMFRKQCLCKHILAQFFIWDAFALLLIEFLLKTIPL